jgi:hypothetical protein
MFGPNQPVILHMLELEQAKNALLGVEMELNDGAFPLLHGIVATTDPVTAFTGVDAIVMVSVVNFLSLIFVSCGRLVPSRVWPVWSVRICSPRIWAFSRVKAI